MYGAISKIEKNLNVPESKALNPYQILITTACHDHQKFLSAQICVQLYIARFNPDVVIFELKFQNCKVQDSDR